MLITSASQQKSLKLTRPTDELRAGLLPQLTARSEEPQWPTLYRPPQAQCTDSLRDNVSHCPRSKQLTSGYSMRIIIPLQIMITIKLQIQVIKAEYSSLMKRWPPRCFQPNVPAELLATFHKAILQAHFKCESPRNEEKCPPAPISPSLTLPPQTSELLHHHPLPPLHTRMLHVPQIPVCMCSIIT